MGLLGNLMHFSRPVQLAIPTSHPIVGRVASTLGYDVASSRDFEERLVPALNTAVHYYDRQVGAIPGPLAISVTAYGHDPALRALFPTADEIRIALGRSIDVKQSLLKLVNGGQGYLHALLGMRCQAASPGLTYADHTLRSLSASETETRNELRDAALSRLMTTFTEHINKLQRNGKLLREEWNIENRPTTAGSPRGQGEYVYAVEELLPEKLLRGIITWLEAPEQHLQVTPAGAAPGSQALAGQGFPVLRSADRRQWLVSTVRFPIQEALDAVREEKRTHRYIFI